MLFDEGALRITSKYVHKLLKKSPLASVIERHDFVVEYGSVRPL